MAVQLRTPDDLIVKPEKKKKGKIFDAKKFAKLGPLALISAPVAAAAGGISALRSDLRAPVLSVGGAGVGAIAGGPAGAKAGFAGGQQLAGAANTIEGITQGQKPGAAEAISQVGGAVSNIPTGKTAIDRKVQTSKEEPSSILMEGLLEANELQDPEQKKQALQALMPAFVKISQRKV